METLEDQIFNKKQKNQMALINDRDKRAAFRKDAMGQDLFEFSQKMEVETSDAKEMMKILDSVAAENSYAKKKLKMKELLHDTESKKRVDRDKRRLRLD